MLGDELVADGKQAKRSHETVSNSRPTNSTYLGNPDHQSPLCLSGKYRSPHLLAEISRFSTHLHLPMPTTSFTPPISP
jgi:hypothetical protein